MVSITKKKRITVRDLMKSRYCTINGNATVADVLKEMKRQDTVALFVENRSEDDAYGLLLVSDIARKVLAKDRASSRSMSMKS